VWTVEGKGERLLATLEEGKRRRRQGKAFGEVFRENGKVCSDFAK
jgi:hypothetical protein